MEEKITRATKRKKKKKKKPIFLYESSNLEIILGAIAVTAEFKQRDL